MKLNERVQGIAELPPVVVNGEEYTGSYLALMVALNPNKALEEAARTPQLVAELGRLAAAAHRAKQESEVAYRIWRDGTLFSVTNSLEAAKKAGFECAVNPGTDSKGKDKPAKCPSVSVAETWLRTQDEYAEYYSTTIKAEEAWATIHAALDAAGQRTWAIRSAEDNQKDREVSESRRIEKIDSEANKPRRKGPPPPPAQRS